MYQFSPTCSGIGKINTPFGGTSAQFDFNVGMFHFQTTKLQYLHDKLIIQAGKNSKEGPIFKIHFGKGPDDMRT